MRKIFFKKILPLLILNLFFISSLLFSQESDSLLLIRVPDKEGYSRYGYINYSGEIVIPPKFINAQDFNEGLALVSLSNDRKGFINKKDELVFECTNCIPSLYFKAGLVAVWLWKEGKYVFMDKLGNIVIDKNFKQAFNFQEGLAAVEFSKFGNRGFINKKGDLVIDTLYSHAVRFTNGYLRCYHKDSWGILDTSGKFTKTLHFKNSGTFQHGLMPVNYDGQWGFINPKGEFEIEPIYSGAKDFSDGLAAVLINEKWGYIDTTGKIVIEPKFYEANEFSEGLAFVNLREIAFAGPDMNAIINKKGDIIFVLEDPLVLIDSNGIESYEVKSFYGPSKFKNGIAQYYTGYHFTGDIKYIRKDGKIIW